MINDGDADIVNLDAGTAYYASINYVSTLFLREKFPMSLQRGKMFLLIYIFWIHIVCKQCS